MRGIGDWAASLLAVAAVAGALATPLFDRLDGLGVDGLYWIDRQFPGAMAPTGDVVVIAIDEETYRRPPFRDTPRVMWTRPLAQVLDAVLAAGPKVVGFDLIYPTSVDTHIPGFERDFLVTLRRGADAGKIVLAEVQHQALPIGPFAGQRFAVRGSGNIRPANMSEDGDGIIRHYPMGFELEDGDSGRRVRPSLGVELATRALGVTPVFDRSGGVSLAGYRPPSADGPRFPLNFPDRDAPTYSLADLWACAGADTPAFFRRHFAGKVVLLGAVLDVEDRVLTSKRFVMRPERENAAERCVHPVMDGLYTTGFARDTMPGVYVHAAAVDNLLRRNALIPSAEPASSLAALVGAALAALAVMKLAPLAAALILPCAGLLWIAGAALAFRSGIVLPLYDPLIAMAALFAILSAYRIAVSDKDRRYIRRVFSYYLPPRVMEHLLRQRDLPTLGGEAREVTILFMDIAGFMSLSEGLTPGEVARFLNDYLTEMSEIIESHGGYIEKFVADEITGVFGAPLADADHAVHACEAALGCQARLAAMTGAFGLPSDRRIEARIGINSGEMLVGNIGSRRRFTYAAMGDAANLGSRLEGANKYYGSRILAGERTVALADREIAFREVDRLQVVGRFRPVRVFIPIARRDDLTPEEARRKAAFERALQHYRSRAFEDAVAGFAALADEDPVARSFAERARGFVQAPPPGDWAAVTSLTEK
jgi:adenylate cyclase